MVRSTAVAPVGQNRMERQELRICKKRALEQLALAIAETETSLNKSHIPTTRSLLLVLFQKR